MNVPLSGVRFDREIGPLIFQTDPLAVSDLQALEVHVLTSKTHITMALWGIKSFCHAIGFVPRLVIHDDGTFDGETTLLLRNHFPGARIITQTEVESDSSFIAWLRLYPTLFYWRWILDSPLARKLIDFYYFSESDYIIGVDSDVLFFKRPDAVLSYSEAREPFVACDWQSAYVCSVEQLADLGIDVLPNANTGLFGIALQPADIDRCESILASLSSNLKHFSWPHYWLEQTILSSIIGTASNVRCLPVELYSLSRMAITSFSISHHFSGPESKKLFFRSGVRHLGGADFIRALSR